MKGLLAFSLAFATVLSAPINSAAEPAALEARTAHFRREAEPQILGGLTGSGSALSNPDVAATVSDGGEGVSVSGSVKRDPEPQILGGLIGSGSALSNPDVAASVNDGGESVSANI